MAANLRKKHVKNLKKALSLILPSSNGTVSRSWELITSNPNFKILTCFIILILSILGVEDPQFVSNLLSWHVPFQASIIYDCHCHCNVNHTWIIINFTFLMVVAKQVWFRGRLVTTPSVCNMPINRLHSAATTALIYLLSLLAIH